MESTKRNCKMKHTAGFFAGGNNVYRGGYFYYHETYRK